MIPTILIAFILFSGYMIYLKTRKPEPETLDPFQVMEIHTRGEQLLESLRIASSTKELITLDKRIDFILEFYSSLVVLSVFPEKYKHEASMALSNYVYHQPKKPLSDTHTDLFFNPNMEKLKDFFSKCIVLCYAEFVKVEVLHIDKLLLDKAIAKRKEKVFEVGLRAKKIYEKYELPTDGYLEAIEEIREQFK